MGTTRAAQRRNAVSSRAHRKPALHVLARRHLERWGLVEPGVLGQAAERLAQAVLADEACQDDAARVGRMRALAERWIADFASGAAHPRGHWIWHASPLLGRFPATFLETPLPEPDTVGAEAGCIAVLPARDPAVIRQQIILGPLEHVLQALRETARRARSAIPSDEPETIADPAE
jgi:hypothetical protein